MGCDIHLFTEVKKEGKWEVVDKPYTPFDKRDYTVFAFLAGVRNYDHCEPLSEPKGLPDDSEELNTPLSEPENYSYSGYDNGTAYTKKGKIECDADYHSPSFLTLKELLDFDYDKTFWNRRVTKQIAPNAFNGAALAEEGEGKVLSYRENLGTQFFKDLEWLKELGSPEDVRIVFYFDN